jgi:hypothetical protein
MTTIQKPHPLLNAHPARPVCESSRHPRNALRLNPDYGWRPEFPERGCPHPQFLSQTEAADEGIRAPVLSNGNTAGLRAGSTTLA